MKKIKELYFSKIRALLKYVFLLGVITLFISAYNSNVSNIAEAKISQEKLIEDLRQLVNIIESTHPDPYIYGGGKISFHKRVHRTISKIPEKGMTKEEFYWLLRPFIASIGDSHTEIDWRPQNYDWKKPGGIPLDFGVVDTILYVKEVFDSSQINLIGCRLKAVENISVVELRERMKHLVGFQNKYRALNKLSLSYLWRGYLLKGLIPEWRNTDEITITLEKPGKTGKDYSFDLPVEVNNQSYASPSKVKLPSLSKSYFNSLFIDKSKKTAILSILSPAFTREAFEKDYAQGYDIKNWASEFYERYNDRTAPENIDEILAGLPSATEHFIDLITKMKQNKTKTLIVDLRRYSGGGFAINHMLNYFLYGKENLKRIVPKGRSVEKLSKKYFSIYSEQNIDSINKKTSIKLNKFDYLFDEDLCGWGDENKVNEAIVNDYHLKYKMLKTFWKVYKDSKYDKYYDIPNVVVICSDNTFSGGHEMMVSLHFSGATILGSPTGQDANQFGDTLPFELTNSGLKGWLSHFWIENFPNQKLKGNVLMPNYIMSYDKLAEYDFDPNAEILYTIDLFE